MRASDERQRAKLKAATRMACDMAGGGKALSARSRVNTPALSKYGSMSEPDHFMPIDVALEADLEAGAPVVVAALADLLGFRLVAKGESGEGEGPTLDDGVDVMRETMDVVKALQEALADGALCANDRRAIHKEIAEACRALYRVKGKL